MALYDFFLSRNNGVDVGDYVGHDGRLFYEADTGIIRISDGVTPGGRPIYSPVLELSVSRSEAVVLSNSDTPTVITGMTLTAPSDGNYIVSFNSEYAVNSLLSATATAAADVSALYAALMALTATVTDHGPTYGGETLGPGVYTTNEATTIVGTLTLDAGNNANAQFVFRCNGAFSTGIASEVVLINGATSNNVWFVSQGAPSTGASSIMRGSMLAATGHNASSGANSTIRGRLLTVSGNISLGNATTFEEPIGTTTLPLNSLLLFNVFAAIGNLANTGASTIALSIGTNSGTISGFDSATILGRIYPAGEAEVAAIDYGIYIDDVLVPDSYRSQTQSTLISKWPMSLQSLVSATAGQVIDVRTQAAIGSFNVGPAMSMVAIVASNYQGSGIGSISGTLVPDRITSPNGFHSTLINNAGETITTGNLLPGNTNATLGSAAYPWKEIFVAPASLYILSDTPGEPTVTIGNEAGFTTISQGGFKIKHDNGTVDALVFSKTGKMTLKSEIPLATDSEAFELIGNLSGQSMSVGNRGVMIHTTGPRDIPNRIYVDGVGRQVDGESAYAAFIGRHANGTAAAPTPTLAGDTIVRFGANGYASGIGLQSISTARIDMVATEDQTSTGRGSKIDFYTTKDGTTVPELTMHLEYHGIDFTGANDPNAGIIFRDGTTLKSFPALTGITTPKHLATDGTSIFWGEIAEGAVVFKGGWDATNPPGGGTPTISDATGQLGWQYIVTEGGVQNLGSGNITFATGDIVLHDGTKYFNIPAAVDQVQGNWTEANSALPAFIKNKPTLATVATSGSYADLTNKPTIPAAQINSDWNSSSGLSQILNKPNITTTAQAAVSVTSATPTGTTSTLTYNNATGVFTFTSAAAPNANTLEGLTLKSTVVNSSLTSVGTLVSGTIGTGFTAIANARLANSSITINGTTVALGGSATITASADAGTLTGTTLASNVVASSLTSVGTLTNLAVASGGTVTTPRIVINDGGIRTVTGGTACTIDFAVDSIVLWTAPSGTGTITLANYTAGARVKLIIALTTNRNINYGISSGANSSDGATSITKNIANTALHLDYTCISALAAGCYVSVKAK